MVKMAFSPDDKFDELVCDMMLKPWSFLLLEKLYRFVKETGYTVEFDSDIPGVFSVRNEETMLGDW